MNAQNLIILKKRIFFNHIVNIHKLDDSEVDLRSLLRNYVVNNTNIIDKGKNWEILLIKEEQFIKNWNPELNNGFQYSYQPKLF